MELFPKFITFDWDGTLADTAMCARLALDTVLAHYNKEPWSVTKVRYRDINKSLKENFPNFFGADADAAYARYLNEYNSHYQNTVKRIEGANDFLDELDRENVPYGIVLVIKSNRSWIGKWPIYMRTGILNVYLVTVQHRKTNRPPNR